MLFHLLLSTLQSDQYWLSCCETKPKIGRCSQCHNEYWFDCKVENRRWESTQNYLLYVCIILWYDQNSNTYLEPKFWVCENEPQLYLEPSQKPISWCAVQVTTPPRQRGLGFWTGLESNQTVCLVQTWTAGRLPGPVANTNPI